MNYEKKYKELLREVKELQERLDNYRGDGYMGSMDYQNGKEDGVQHAALELDDVIYKVEKNS